jgi:hypothetical protein
MYETIARNVPIPRWRRQPTWAAVATAIGPGSIWANASDSRNSSSDSHRFWRTVTCRI